MTEPLGISLFSDDIRFELHNKISLIGCYGPEMIITGDFPFLLSKLGIFVQLRLPPGNCSPSRINIYLPDSKDDDPAVVVNIGAPTAANVEKSQQPVGSDAMSLLGTNVPILITPVQINAEGFIKVRVICGEKIIKAGTLKITRAPQQSPNVTLPASPQPPS